MSSNDIYALERRLEDSNDQLTKLDPSDKDYSLKISNLMNQICSLETQIRSAKANSSSHSISTGFSFRHNATPYFLSSSTNQPSSLSFPTSTSSPAVNHVNHSISSSGPSSRSNTPPIYQNPHNQVANGLQNGGSFPQAQNNNFQVPVTQNNNFPNNNVQNTTRNIVSNPNFASNTNNSPMPQQQPVNLKNKAPAKQKPTFSRPQPVPEIVELLDSDDEIIADQQPSQTSAPSTGKRDRNVIEIIELIDSDDEVQDSTASNKKIKRDKSTPPTRNDAASTVEALEEKFNQNRFPKLDKTQKEYSQICIRILKEHRAKYDNYFKSTNDQWKAIQEKISILKGQALNDSQSTMLQEHIASAKYSWEMKNLYSRYREYYSDSLKNILSAIQCNFKKYHVSLVETVKRLEDQAIKMPKLLMEQTAMKKMMEAQQRANGNSSASVSISTNTNIKNNATSPNPAQPTQTRPTSSPEDEFLDDSDFESRPTSHWNPSWLSEYSQNAYNSSFTTSRNPNANNASASERESLFDFAQNYTQQSVEAVTISAVDKEELAKLLASINVEDYINPEDRIGTPESLTITLLEHQKIALTWLLKKENTLMGGILADDMGLGKTIQMISLIVSNRSTDPECKATLVLAPVALLKQWEREFDTRIKPEFGLSVCVYHGSKRKNKTFEELKKYDVVLTTYGIIGNEHKEHFPSEETIRRSRSSSAGNSPFFQPNKQWYRIILDEAQWIKNRNTVAAKACCALNAMYRWCLSGTPMQNNVLEIQSLIKFLRIQPYDDERKFSFDISKPLENYTAGKSSSCKNAMKKLQAILKAIMLRRTKQSLIDGRPILQLPPKDVIVETYEISNDEREYYNHLENGAIQQMNRYLVENTIAKNYSSILVMLLRLRQACDHPKIVERAHLIKEKATMTARSGPQAVAQARRLNRNIVERIKHQAAFTCPMCLDAIEKTDVVLIAPCGHHVCADCCGENFQQHQDEENSGYRCPSCQISIYEKNMMDYIVFEWVHIKHLTDGAIRVYRQDYRATTNNRMNENAAVAAAEHRNNAANGTNGNISEDDDDDDDDSLFSTSKTPNGVKAESVKQEEAAEGASQGASNGTFNVVSNRTSNGVKTEEGSVKPDPGGAANPEIEVNPDNKYSKKMANPSIPKDDFLGPPVPREDLVPCFPRGWVSSTKIEECLKIIKRVHSEYPGEKILVFSQFMSMLDFVEVALTLDSSDICYGRYDGSMSSTKRHDVVTSFFDDPQFSVLLISLKAGNIGLTLTAASHVIILDPFWNPFVEEQAMDRAHRIGQIRHIYVHRLLVKESVEDRILALQEKKRSVIDAVMDEKEMRNASRLNQNELLYLFGLNSRGQRSNGQGAPQ